MLDSPLKYRREQRAHLLRLPRSAVGDGDVHVLAVGDVVAREQQEVEGCEYIKLLSTCKCRLTLCLPLPLAPCFPATLLPTLLTDKHRHPMV